MASLEPSSASPGPVAAGTPPLALSPPSNARSYRQIGYVFAAVGALLFSTKAIAIKLVYGGTVDAVTLLALRMGLSVPIYLVIGALAVRDRKTRGTALPDAATVLKAAAIGALGYWIASYFDFLGLEYISAQFERLILFTYPLFVVIFGALFFHQPMKLRTLAAIGVSYLGLALIFTANLVATGANVAVGAGLVLISALAFALYQLFAREAIVGMGPRLFTCIAMSGAAVAVFGQFAVTRPVAAELAAVSPRVWVISLYLAIGATVLPSFFLNAALHRISAQANATIGTLSPVMTIVLAVLILGEPLTLANIAGTVLVLAGVGWFTLADRRRTGS